MNTNKIFTILIAVLMISSTLGFALWSSANNQPEQEPDDITPPNTNPTEIGFVADNVNAKVVELIPSLRIAADTEELNIDAIDSSIFEIRGVRNVSSSYSRQETGSLLYIATIVLEADANRELAINSLYESNLISGIEAYTFALIELPKKIEFYSENSELGLRQEYEFGDSLSNALLGIEAQKNDELIVSVSATFIGNTLTDLFAYEIQNISASPVYKEAELELPVVSLEKSLFFSANAFYSDIPTQAELENALSEISDVNSAEASIYAIAPKILLSKTEAISEETLHDVNVVVQALEIQRFDYDNTGSFSGEIVFDADADLVSAKLAIETGFSESGIEGISLEENSTSLGGQLSLLTENTSLVSAEAKSVLESFSLREIDFGQPAELSLETITDANTNETFSVPDARIHSTLKAGRSIGEIVPVKIVYSVVRGQIDYIEAAEE